MLNIGRGWYVFTSNFCFTSLFPSYPLSLSVSRSGSSFFLTVRLGSLVITLMFAYETLTFESLRGIQLLLISLSLFFLSLSLYRSVSLNVFLSLSLAHTYLLLYESLRGIQLLFLFLPLSLSLPLSLYLSPSSFCS